MSFGTKTENKNKIPTKHFYNRNLKTHYNDFYDFWIFFVFFFVLVFLHFLLFLILFSSEFKLYFNSMAIYMKKFFTFSLLADNNKKSNFYDVLSRVISFLSYLVFLFSLFFFCCEIKYQQIFTWIKYLNFKLVSSFLKSCVTICQNFVALFSP